MENESIIIFLFISAISISLVGIFCSRKSPVITEAELEMHLKRVTSLDSNIPHNVKIDSFKDNSIQKRELLLHQSSSSNSETSLKQSEESDRAVSSTLDWFTSFRSLAFTHSWPRMPSITFKRIVSKQISPIEIHEVTIQKQKEVQQPNDNFTQS